MRYIHGRKPRNPFNMIIQENHVVGEAYFYYSTFPTDLAMLYYIPITQ